MSDKGETWTIWFILSGDKKAVAASYTFHDRLEYEEAWNSLPFDIEDQDEHNTWFDYGDK